jgi:hypothetical protein
LFFKRTKTKNKINPKILSYNGVGCTGKNEGLEEYIRRTPHGKFVQVPKQLSPLKKQPSLPIEYEIEHARVIVSKKCIKVTLG